MWNDGLRWTWFATGYIISRGRLEFDYKYVKLQFQRLCLLPHCISMFNDSYDKLPFYFYSTKYQCMQLQSEFRFIDIWQGLRKFNFLDIKPFVDLRLYKISMLRKLSWWFNYVHKSLGISNLCMGMWRYIYEMHLLMAAEMHQFRIHFSQFDFSHSNS